MIHLTKLKTSFAMGSVFKSVLLKYLSLRDSIYSEARRTQCEIIFRCSFGCDNKVVLHIYVELWCSQIISQQSILMFFFLIIVQ